mgnify:CR=1 FL=1
MGKIIGKSEQYDPSLEYYFVDYKVISLPRWVRSPFCTVGEVRDILESLPYVWDNKADNKTGQRMELNVSEIRVQSERELSRLHQDWDEENQKWVNSPYTKRQVIFGQSYEDGAVLTTGEASLSKQEDESQEEWENRVKDTKDIRRFKEREHTDKISDLVTNQDEIRKQIGLSPTDRSTYTR